MGKLELSALDVSSANFVKGLNPLIRDFNHQVIHTRVCSLRVIFKNTAHCQTFLFIKSRPIKIYSCQ
jgi:hypothetical protein